MDHLNKLNLNRSDDDIHNAVQRFEAKWQTKAEQSSRSDSIA